MAVSCFKDSLAFFEAEAAVCLALLEMYHPSHIYTTCMNIHMRKYTPCIMPYPPTTDGVLDTKNAPYLFTCYPSPNPFSGALFQTIAGGGRVHVPRGDSKTLGVFDSPRVRFRILSSYSGTSPASSASSASAPAKDADDASDAGDVAHAGEGNEGGKGGKHLNSERGGKDLREEREKIWGKNALRGKGGKRSLGGRGKSWVRKGLRGDRGERISIKKGGKSS